MSLQEVSKSMGGKKTQTSLSQSWLVQYGTKGTFTSFCCKDLDVPLSVVMSCVMSVFYSTTQFDSVKVIKYVSQSHYPRCIH
jgi:hypothetical protein